MENGNYVTISLERYEQLIRAEHDANQLKSLIANKEEHYGTIDHEQVSVLYSIYIGDKEENEE